MSKNKRRKRENGEGSLWQRPNGTWAVSVTVPGTKGRERLVASAKSRDLAKVELDNLRARVKKMAPARSVKGGLTVRALATAMIDAAAVDDATRDSYRYALAHVGWLGDMMIHKVTTVALTNWLADIRPKVGGRSLEILASVVKRACEHAAECGLISVSPFTMKVAKTRRKEISPFDVTEARKIIAETAADRVGAAIVLILACGLRQGEVFGARWSDVDWKNAELAIARQIVERKGGLTIKVPKTRRSIRRIALPPFVMDALRERQRVALTEGFAKPDDWVFPTRRGKPMRRSNFGNRHWRPLLKRLKLTHRGLHTGRHTSLSLMLAERVPIQDVASVAGHASPEILLGTYAHSLPGAGRAAANAIQNVLGCITVASKSS